MVTHGRKLAVSLLVLLFTTALTASPVAKALIPSAAPAGARAVVVGSGLDAPDLAVAFTAETGTRPALIVSRAASVVDLVIPTAAVTGPAIVSSNGVTVATFTFTRTTESSYPNVTTLVASTRAGDELKNLSAIAVSASGTIYIADSMHHVIKARSAEGELRTIAGNGNPGFVNGVGTLAQFKEPRGIAFDESTKTLYVSDTGNHSIRKIAEDGRVTTLAGDGQPGFSDGAAARFKFPVSLASDSSGLFVADSGNHAIRRITFSGLAMTVAGRGFAGFLDGDAASALFNEPNGIALSPEGILFVADTKNNTIRQIKEGRVSTVAGTTLGGFTNGSLQVAAFKQPTGLAVTAQGDLLVADTMNHALRLLKLTAREVSTFAGTGQPGLNDGPAQTALFKEPAGIVVQGAIYVADSKNDAIRVLYPAITFSDIYPRRGPLAGGTPVRIFGAGFIAGQTQVVFGGISAAVTFIDSTELLVTAPAHQMGSVDIRVTAPAGTGTLAAAYEYVAPPTLASIEPHAGPVAGGQAVTILGTNFDEDSIVRIGGVTCPVIAWNSTNKVTVTTPPGASGVADVVIETAGGSATFTGAYEYFAAPRIDRFSPLSGSSGTLVTIEGDYFSTGSTVVSFNGIQAVIQSVTMRQVTVLVPMGATTGKIAVTTPGGMTVSVQNFTVPVLTIISITPANPILEPGKTLQLTATGTYSDSTTRDVTILVSWSSSNPIVATISAVGTATSVTGGVTNIEASLSGVHGATTLQVKTGQTLPPDPATVATAIPADVPTRLFDAVSFLFTGANSVQTGVAAGTIDPNRTSVVRGRVITAESLPISGARVTIRQHPEYGSTLTRIDGRFDLVVNSAPSLTVSIAKQGFFDTHRAISAAPKDYTVVEDVVLTTLDVHVTTIDLTAPTIQMAQGSLITDSAGTRQAMMLFSPGTTARAVLPDGTSQSLTTLHVRATEYTVGPLGPRAMPATLPAQSGYTYCVELSVDEAMEQNATGVEFTKPVIFYVHNFLHFRVGTPVPVGYYDRSRGLWIPMVDGKILKIVGITDGRADVDLDGDDIADPGIDAGEREQLARTHTVGQSLWRASLMHFSPLDLNWPWGVPAGARFPNQRTPVSASRRKVEKPDCSQGSIIDCQNQGLGESLPISGTPFSLHYDSSTAVGNRSAYVLDIKLSGPTVPVGLKRIELSVSVAGRRFEYAYPPTASLTKQFVWDGLDAYGRRMQGTVSVSGSIDYVYQAEYQEPAARVANFNNSFGYLSGVIMIGNPQTPREIVLRQPWTSDLGSLTFFDPAVMEFGGWTLGSQHLYEENTATLHFGYGGSRALRDVVSTIAGNGSGAFSGDGGPAIAAGIYGPIDVVVAADGTFFVAESGSSVIRRVTPDGRITTYAGIPGSLGFSGDGGLATAARLNSPSSIALADNGDLYIADAGNRRIRKVTPQGIISTVAGNGTKGTGGDRLPATQAQFVEPYYVAIGPDNSLYIGDRGSPAWNVRRVAQDGTIGTIAGGGQFFQHSEGIPASSFGPFNHVGGLAVAPDGTIYVSDNFIWRIGTDGLITRYAGTGNEGAFGGDGGPARDAKLSSPIGLEVAKDGSLYFIDLFNNRIRRIGTDGIISTIFGTGEDGFTAEGSSPGAGMLEQPQGIGLAPDGSLYLADTYGYRIRRIATSIVSTEPGTRAVASEDGSELYVFDLKGHHLKTIDALTGLATQVFKYDTAGLVTGILDRNGNETRVVRTTTAIKFIAPGGQETILAINGARYLGSITNSAAETTRFEYAQGLLGSMVTPRAGTYRFTYDADGHLIRDEDPAHGSKELSVQRVDADVDVTIRTAMGRATEHSFTTSPSGVIERTTTDPAGLQTRSVQLLDGTETTTGPSGAAVTMLRGPDSRFGMTAPVLTTGTMTTPGGLTSTFAQSRVFSGLSTTNPLAFTTLTDTSTINGHTWTNSYARSTNTIESRSPLGRTSTMTLDGKGRPSSVRVPGFAMSSFVYDATGLLNSVGQGNRQITFVYNAKREVTSVIDALHRTVSFEYDGAGRVTKQTLPDTRVISFSYDADGNMTSLTPPSRPSHGFTFTPVGLEDSYTPPVTNPGGITSYQYNKDRQLTLVTRPDGGVITPHYDGAGRMDMLTAGAGIYRYAYSGTSGSLESVTAPDGGTLGYTYDGSLMTGISWTGAVAGNVAFAYDQDFRLTTESTNGSTISYGYDGDGLLTSAGLLSISRDPQSGLVKGGTLGNVADVWNYDAFGEPLTYTATAAGTDAFKESFVRDDAGRITAITESRYGMTFTRAFTYDSAGRLHEVKRNGVVESVYEYDENSNRKTKTAGGLTATASYDTQDRMLTYGSTSYTYSANGALLTKTDSAGTTSYTYDALGNLTRVLLPNATVIDYIVDGQNRRVGKKVDGTLVQGWLYANQLQIIAETDGSGTIVKRFVYATRSNIPDYMVTSSSTYRIVSDHLGSPRYVLDSSSGAITASYEFDEFGNLTQSSNGGALPFGFAGGLYDADTKLVRFGARDYDSYTARWTAKDPKLFAGGDTNLYGYVQNDPINLIDPTGTDWVDTTANISAGIGDALLFGMGDELRSWTDNQFGWGGDALVDRCSGAYRVSTGATSAAMLAVGTARIGYAAGAKGIALGAGSAEEAVAARNALKVAGRFGLNDTARVYTTEQMLEKYGTAEEVIAAAGRTNVGFNSAGAAAIGGAINNLLNQPDCGCR